MGGGGGAALRSGLGGDGQREEPGGASVVVFVAPSLPRADDAILGGCGVCVVSC